MTYTSAPLEADLHILGEVSIEVYCSTDKPSFDLCAVLSTVQPDGKMFNFTQGYISIHSNSEEVEAISFSLQSIYVSQQDIVCVLA